MDGDSIQLIAVKPDSRAIIKRKKPSNFSLTSGMRRRRGERRRDANRTKERLKDDKKKEKEEDE